MVDWSKADLLLQNLERDPNNGELANDLLEQIFQGYPVENIRCLLLSHDESLLKAGIWIASELGSKCRPLHKEISTLLNNPNYYVRFFAIDCVLSTLHKDDHELILKVSDLLEDQNAVVRRKVMDFLARIPAEQISDVLQISAFSSLRREHKEGIELMISPAQSQDLIQKFISCENPILRRYGASAAARIYRDHPNLLDLAFESDDDDLRIFASGVIKPGSPR